MVQLCGLLPHFQNHTYYAGIMLDAFAYLLYNYAKNYAGIIDSGLPSWSQCALHQDTRTIYQRLLEIIRDYQRLLETALKTSETNRYYESLHCNIADWCVVGLRQLCQHNVGHNGPVHHPHLFLGTSSRFIMYFTI